MTNVLYPVLEHDQTLDTETPCEASLFGRVNTGFFQNIRVDHATTTQLYPASVAADVAAFFLAKHTAGRKLEARFGEREIERLDFYFNVATVIVA